MTRQYEVVSTEQIEKMAFDLGEVKAVVGLINDLINYMPAVDDPKVQRKPLYEYGKNQKTLSKVYEVNQDLHRKLEEISNELFDILEELEMTKENKKSYCEPEISMQ